ncbi:MAG: ABC transporter permease [bacterium]|nr:ABC transporter permease [bacterium]MCP5067567.1 ABC transporter permease [bacterium]
MSQLAALPSSIVRLGDRVLTGVGALGEFGLLIAASFRAVQQRGIPLRETALQFELIAVRSTPIVAVTALFTGMVLALQTAFALSRFGAKPYVGSILGLAIVRELGPVLAALMVAGRVGAGITSELGSMKVTEQVDAIRAMGADPVEKLVLPRVIAATVGLPLLTLFAIVLGILGGLLVADLQYRIAPDFFLQTVSTAVTVGDFFSGVIKTFVFGWTLAMVACFVGLRADGGTAGVGRATTQSVVVASIAVLVSDFFLTKLLMLVPTDRILISIGRLLS